MKLDIKMTCFALSRLGCPSFMTTHICICSERYVVVPLKERGNIAVWTISNLLEKPLILIGHHRTVTALALSNRPKSHYLCSCSTDNIILWDLLQNQGLPTSGKVIHSDLQEPIECTFCLDNSKIAFSFSNGMWIYDLKGMIWLMSLEDVHLTLLHFKNKQNELLGIEENFLKTWNLKTKEITSNISISSGFPTTFSIHESGILVIGTTCGRINVYDNATYTLLRSIPVWKLISQNMKQEAKEEDISKLPEMETFSIQSTQIFQDLRDSNSYLPPKLYLISVTSTCMFILNISNEEIMFFLDFNDSGKEQGIEANIGIIRASAIHCSYDCSMAYVSIIPIMSEYLVLIKLQLRDILTANENESQAQSKREINRHTEDDAIRPFLTFLSSGSTENGKSLLAPKCQVTGHVKNSKKVSSNLNKPVTFHAKIKSSGYGTLHKPIALFQPQISKAHRDKYQNHFPLVPSHRNLCDPVKRQMNFKNLKLFTKIESFENPVLSSLQTTVHGEFASCTSSEGLIDIIKLGKNRIKILQTINAHKAEVNAAKWSHSEKLLISASRDRLAKIWSLDKQQPLLTIGVNGNDTVVNTKRKFTFPDGVEEAQFYYLDRFVLAAAGHCVYLFDYSINVVKSGIKRFENKSSLKLVKAITLDTKRITTLVAMNQFFSNLVLCAGSSKCIDAIDMTVGKVICHTVDPSSKPAYQISLNEGSPYTSQAPSMYNLFLTASLFDGIKIWDLRIDRPVLCYKEHRCRSFACGAVFSPCGQYIATGSEDKSIYIYDLRQLKHMDKLYDQQTDVFTSVAFSPKSQLLASSLNGLISLYGSNSDC